MRRNIGANIDGALERFRCEIDHRNAAVGVLVLPEDAAAVNGGVDLAAIRRADQLVRRGRHIEVSKMPKRAGVEPLNLVGALCGEDERVTTGPGIWIEDRLSFLSGPNGW